MRILQAIAGLEHGGGAESFFLRLALAFQKAGVSQRVVIRKNSARAKTLRAGGIDPVELPFGGRLDLRTPWMLKRQIKAHAPHIVLTWMNRATRMCPRGDFTHIARLGGYYDLKYYRKCDHLIGNTEDIVKYLVDNGWPEDRAHCLPNFVGEEKASPADRKSLFTPNGVPLIFAMGRLHENKAFDVLLKAVARIPDAYLWLAGEGPLRAELEAMAEKLSIKPRVRFLGWRNDTAALLSACDIFVCPSRHEPFGNVILEAWAQGAPMVATDNLGPGMLIDSMVNGVLVPVDDSQKMGQAIQDLLANDELRASIASAGHAEYESNFTEAIVTKQYLSFFQKVLS